MSGIMDPVVQLQIKFRSAHFGRLIDEWRAITRAAKLNEQLRREGRHHIVVGCAVVRIPRKKVTPTQDVHVCDDPKCDGYPFPNTDDDADL